MINLYHLDYDTDELESYLKVSLDFISGSNDYEVNYKATNLQNIIMKLETHRFTINEIGLLCGALECLQSSETTILSKRLELQLHGQF